MQELATDSKGLIINHAYITDTIGTGFYALRDAIADSLTRAMEDIESQSQKNVSKYYLGWVCLNKATPTQNLKESASSLAELQSTWEHHKKSSHGKDGLLVLSAISHESIPKSREDMLTVKEYTMAVCQQILHLLKIVSGDNRLCNINTTDETCESNEADICIIYATLTLSD